MLVPILEQLAPMFGEIAQLLADSLMQVIQALAPMLPPLADAFMRIVEAVLPLLPVIFELALSILPPLISVIMALLPVIEPIIGIVTLLIEIFANLVAFLMPILIPVIEKLGEIMTKIFNGIADVVKDVIGKVAEKLEGFKSGLQSAKDFVGEAVENIKGFFTGMGDAIGGVWDTMVRNIAKAVGRVGELMKKAGGMWGVPDGVGSTGEKLVSWAKLNGFANGGKVAGQRSNGVLFGPGTGTSDDILGLSQSGLPTARVAAGEMLVNKVQTDRNLPLLTAINAGWTPSADMVRALVYGSGLPTFAGGGVVGSFKETRPPVRTRADAHLR